MDKDQWNQKFNEIWNDLEVKGKLDSLENPITTREIARISWMLALKTLQGDPHDGAGST